MILIEKLREESCRDLEKPGKIYFRVLAPGLQHKKEPGADGEILR
jgi:hypothetical protein